MGLGCLNPGRCNCGTACWDCPFPTSISIASPIGFPLFDVFNGVHLLGDPGESCQWFESIAQPYDLYAWRALPTPEVYTLYSNRNNNGAVKYIKQSDGTELTQAENPAPDPGVSVYNHIAEDILIAATKRVTIEAPAKVSLTLQFLLAQDISMDNYGFTAAFQTLLARVRLYEFEFISNLIACSGVGATWTSTDSVEASSWPNAFFGNAVKADTGAYAIAATDFDVSIVMP